MFCDLTDKQIASATKRLRRTDGTIRLSDFNDQWDGFYIGSDGLLYNPMWRKGFTAGDLKAQFWQLQSLSRALHECDRYKRERDAAIQAQERAEEHAGWYRRQLSLESTAGAMLATLLEL